jgi:hypothetical protein
MIAFFAIESIYNWEEVKQDISNGWNDGYNQQAATKPSRNILKAIQPK